MEIWIDKENRKFHRSCSDKRRKPVSHMEDLYAEIPDVDEFAQYLHDEETKERFHEWCGSIANKDARQTFYRTHHAFVRSLIVVEAARNGEFHPPRKRRKAKADKPAGDDESQDTAGSED